MTTATASAPGTFTRARRGDAVVIAETHRDYVISGPGRREVTERTTYELGTVTSVTRDGYVKSWRLSWSESSRPIPDRRAGLWLMPAADFDVAGCVAAANANKYPGHPDGLPKPFDSLDDVRAAMAPHRR